MGWRLPSRRPRGGIVRNLGRSIITNGAGYIGSHLSPDIWIPLNDLGNGEVDIRMARGNTVPIFARASNSWTILPDGSWGLVPPGVPRSYYTPSGIYKGYLPEVTSTNRCLRSQDFSVAPWNNVGTPTLIPNTTVLGALSLSTLGDDSNTAFEGKQQAITYIGDGPKVISVFVRRLTSASSVIRIIDSTLAQNKLIAAITWNGDIPVVTMSIGTDLTGVPEQYKNSGVYRLSFLSTAITAANLNLVALYPATNAALAVDQVGTIEIGGIQPEDQLTPTTYMPTLGATVQRIGDQLTYPKALQMPATMYAEVHNIFVNINSNRQHWVDSVLDSGEMGFVLERDDSATPPPFSVIVKDGIGSFPGVVNVGQQLQNTTNKVAGYFSLNNINAFIDGVAGVPDLASPALTTMQSIGIGCAPPAEGNQQQPNGCIKDVRFWQRVEATLALQHLTGV